MDTGPARVFGDDPNDLLFAAVMASTALPPLHPPWRCNGAAYADGACAVESKAVELGLTRKKK